MLNEKERCLFLLGCLFISVKFPHGCDTRERTRISESLTSKNAMKKEHHSQKTSGKYGCNHKSIITFISFSRIANTKYGIIQYYLPQLNWKFWEWTRFLVLFWLLSLQLSKYEYKKWIHNLLVGWNIKVHPGFSRPWTQFSLQALSPT